MRGVAIIGVGMHKFGRFPEKPYWEMGRDAATQALKDAGVPWKDVQALYAGSMFGGSGVGNNVLAQMGLSGIPVSNVEAACSSGPAALSQAYQAVSAGFCDVALVVGVEKQEKGMIDLTNFPLWMRQMGLVNGPGFYAQEARVHMEKYGTTVQQFARVSVKSHKNAALCPDAYFQQFANLTVEDVLTSRMISDPLTLYMMAPVVDGAAAVVICAQGIAHKYTGKKPVTVAACAVGSANYDRYTLQEPPSMVKRTAQRAYEVAGIGPKDLDVVECQDAVASAEIMSYESLGLCPEGRGGDSSTKAGRSSGATSPSTPTAATYPVGTPPALRALPGSWRSSGSSGERRDPGRCGEQKSASTRTSAPAPTPPLPS